MTLRIPPLPMPPVELPGKVVDLRSGFSHAVAILENGDVYTWGKMQGTEVKTDGRVPVYHDQLYPRKVYVGGGRAVEAFCSSFNTLLRMEDGRVLMSGLEADTRKTVTTPVEVRHWLRGSGRAEAEKQRSREYGWALLPRNFDDSIRRTRYGAATRC